MVYEVQREVPDQKGVWEVVKSYTDVEMALAEEARRRREFPGQEYRTVGSASGSGLKRAQE